MTLRDASASIVGRRSSAGSVLSVPCVTRTIGRPSARTSGHQPGISARVTPGGGTSRADVLELVPEARTRVLDRRRTGRDDEPLRVHHALRVHRRSGEAGRILRRRISRATGTMAARSPAYTTTLRVRSSALRGGGAARPEGGDERSSARIGTTEVVDHGRPCFSAKVRPPYDITSFTTASNGVCACAASRSASCPGIVRMKTSRMFARAPRTPCRPVAGNVSGSRSSSKSGAARQGNARIPRDSKRGAYFDVVYATTSCPRTRSASASAVSGPTCPATRRR